ncbi:class I SAM-dependent methyltransferase [Streptomyces sp. AC495_CC817]|uniref:class I SAM-dependent methyltransferase n=1 Tax=Streptomyces sp. AC495_CC817 TaxID=2823900 RepID=UPI001C255B62|nr:class I SAM-dependent methyltransferase [Streptomyces sp. AC495_CC817]
MSASGRRSSGADETIAAAYDARAAEYIEVAGALEQMDDRDLRTIAAWRDTTTGVLLDAGCGPGHWTEFLSRGGRDVCGVDLSSEFVASARATFPGVRFEVGSFRRLPSESGSVGGILSWYSLIHTPPDDVPDVLVEFARVLAPGGNLLLGFFDGEARARFAHDVVPAHYWSTKALGGLLADAGFEVTGVEHREREPGEVTARPHAAIRALLRRSTP